MAFGELPVACPACGHRTVLPVAAIKRDNYYCSKCFEKVPLSGVRTTTGENDSRRPPAPKKSSRTARR